MPGTLGQWRSWCRRPRCSGGDAGEGVANGVADEAHRRGCSGALGEEGRDRRMAVEISEVTRCPSDDLITAANLDYPRTRPVDGYAFEVQRLGRKQGARSRGRVRPRAKRGCVLRANCFAARCGQRVWQQFVTIGVLEGGRNGRTRTGLHRWGEGCLPGWTPTRDRGNTRQAIKTTGGGPSARL